ncbi:MAG: peptide-methionine (S)-S-oxide reductase MsrA, partial [Actinomycetes bacterium]|nr:peptide-methionine (S)-S-oxide reductase MsrA [Actinomycetes bacterium]
MTTTLQRPRPIADGEAELILAGGCFWGTQAFLSSLPGVRATAAGYVNSRITSPSYAQVCAGLTGAAEAVWVAYDPAELSLWTLLDLWARSIDVTAVNRQGGDVGEQYRSGLYAINAQDIPV